MGKNGLSVHPLGKVAQPIGTRIEVGVVYLIDIAGEDDFSALSCACNDSFYLVWRKVL